MRHLATVREISSLHPIPNADRIELAVVDGWKCVVKVGEFSEGQQVIYCEIDSFLPVRPEFEFLRKSSFKQMGTSEGFRLRTVKLRGQFSQGLLLPLAIIDRSVVLGEDVTDDLGIVKYEPPIPACLHGEVIGGFPSSVEKTEEERIQNLAADYQSFLGKTFVVSEKLDGTSMTVVWDPRSDQSLGVCGRNWRYAPSKSNSYWLQCERLNLGEKLANLGRRIAIQGELVGSGIQGNRYALAEQEWFVFNAFDLDAAGYMGKDELPDLCEHLGLSSVPVIEQRTVPATIDEILLIAEGVSVLNPKAQREGLVWVSGAGQNRTSFKTISNRFLEKE